MTPEERARADAINAAISKFSKERKNLPIVAPAPKTPPEKSIPGISPKARSTNGNGLRYALIFVAVALAHTVGFLTYQDHADKKEREAAARIAEAHAKSAAEMLAARQAAEAAAEQLRMIMAEKRANPKIEYNIYRDPIPPPQQPPAKITPRTPRPTPVVRQIAQAPKRAAPDPKPLHQTVAMDYLHRKKSNVWNARAVSTEQVPGWDGRFRTEFEIPRESYSGNSLPRPRRYEVLTQEKDGQITGIDITTKGY